MEESLRRCDLQMASSHTETQSLHMVRTWVPARRNRFGEASWQRWPHLPLDPQGGQSQAIFTGTTTEDSKAGPPPLAPAAVGEALLWAYLRLPPLLPCPGSPHFHSSPGLLLSNHFSYGIAQQFLLPPCAALPLSVPKPSLSPSSFPSSQADNHENTKRSVTALSCFLPKGRE